MSNALDFIALDENIKKIFNYLINLNEIYLKGDLDVVNKRKKKIHIEPPQNESFIKSLPSYYHYPFNKRFSYAIKSPNHIIYTDSFIKTEDCSTGSTSIKIKIDSETKKEVYKQLYDYAFQAAYKEEMKRIIGEAASKKLKIILNKE